MRNSSLYGLYSIVKNRAWKASLFLLLIVFSFSSSIPAVARQPYLQEGFECDGFIEPNNQEVEYETYNVLIALDNSSSIEESADLTQIRDGQARAIIECDSTFWFHRVDKLGAGRV